MSKELEAYRRLCRHLDYDNDDYMFNGDYEEDNKVIETALKDYELAKQTKIITVDKEISDDDLEKLTSQRMFVDNSEQCEIKLLLNEEFQKKITALEIIKDKKVDVPYIIENPGEKDVIWYNTRFMGVLCEGWRMLSQEEYDLLREVLLND